MKKIILLSAFLVFSFNSYSQEESIKIDVTTQNTTANPVGAFNSARMAEWRNMRARRLQKYQYNPTKTTTLKLYRANKVIGLPLDDGIAEEDVKKWLPKIKLDKKVVVTKKITRDEAVKQLKEAKEMLDMGILTKDEYDSLSKKLKPIIIDN
tara:strand:- start:12 stop:467 length:456 start_codon:yes stop_codon:yes gene_type:complete